MTALLIAVSSALSLSFAKPLASGHLNFCDNLRRFDVALEQPMNLAEATGVAFELKCMDPTVVEDVWLLFKSGAGYYRAAAAKPSQAGVWTTTTVAKADVRLYHWDAHVSLWEKMERPDEKDLPDWSRVQGFQVVVAIDIDATSTDASVEARGFTPVFAPLTPRSPVLPAKRIERLPNERRLICTHVWGVDHDWDRTCRDLVKYGITDVSPLIAHGGYTYYKTRFGFEHPLVAKYGDALKLSVAACHKYGMKCHPRRSCWSLGINTDPETLAAFRKEGRLQVDFNGKEDAWLCPTHPDNLRREVEGMLELAEAGADGIMIDYFRYPNRNFCFCERCRRMFEVKVGRKVEPWPQAVRTDETLSQAWSRFRCDVMSEAFAEVSRQVKKVAPKLELSAAVSATVKGGEDRGQDWSRWCRDGGLDVLYPMCYYSTEKMLKRDLVELKAAVAGTRTKLVPLLAFACGAIPFVEPAGLARQIEIQRAEGIRDLAFFRLQEYAPTCLDAVFAPAAVGPSANPDDQYRFFWLLGRAHYETCRDAGLNLFINSTRESRWWAMTDEQRAKLSPEDEAFRFIRRVHADGLDYVEKLALNACKDLRAVYPQQRKDGSPNLRSYDLANPAFIARRKALFAEAADSVKDFPIVGVHPSSEVRDGSKPSFTPWYRAKCRAELGYDMPEDITATRLTLRQLPDLPLSGVVAKSYRPLEYLTWFWRTGDGWNPYQDEVMEIFRSRTGKKNLISIFDPVTRTPPLWGMGGDLTFGDQWYYSCPEPYGLSFGVSEQHAMSRGTPGRGDFAIAQGIINRDWAVPRGAKVENPPDWIKTIDPKIRYVSMPADFIREGIWTLFSRKLDGIGLYGCAALFPNTDAPRDACTDPTAFAAVADAFRRVGIKLGPLLRAVPERRPPVAFLESAASSILASKGSMGWSYGYGDLMVAANLAPYVIYEEEIEASGIPSDVKLLVMPDAPVLLEKTFAAVKAFQAKGGLVASDGESVPGILPDVTLPAEIPRTRAPRITFTARDGQVMRQAAKALRESVAHAVVPYADSDNAEIIVHARTYGAADYVFAVNDRRGFGDYTGPWKRMNEKGLPNAGTVIVRRTAGAVYDLEKQCAVDFETTDGTTRIPVSYTTTDGRIFLVSPRKLAFLGVTRTGETLTVTSADADVMVPIAVSAPGVKTRYGVVTDGTWSRTFPASADVTVTNLADGRTYSVGAVAGARLGADVATALPPPSGVIPEGIRARAAVRAALGKEEGFEAALKGALASDDAAVRRYALYRLFERDGARAEGEAKRFLDDPSPMVRILAKRIVRRNEPARANEAWSLSPQNDHSTVCVKSVRVKKGAFVFPADLSGHEAIELWFGRPETDLYVTLNGIPLGQFDADAEKGNEFRLDATKETKLGEPNVLEIKDARGNPVKLKKVTAEAVRW